MTIGIDASNIRNGGGITHLKSLLAHIEPATYSSHNFVIWSSQATLTLLPEYSFLTKKTHAFLNKSTLYTFLFQLFFLKKEAKDCDLIFVPGGTFISSFRPFVTLSQNMLPFEKEEAKAYGLKMRLRLKILYYTQSYTFKKANGLIFLSEYARNYILNKTHIEKRSTTLIPHGVDIAFQMPPRPQKKPNEYDTSSPFELLYISYISIYKHQWNIAEAVCQLHLEGIPIKLKLIGSVLDSFEKLETIMKNYPNFKECIDYKGGMPHEALPFEYQTADAFVFGSSCENLPIILLEAMKAGLPIASSNYGPMSEIMGASAIYFNPKKVSSIKNALYILFHNTELRQQIAHQAYHIGNTYCWKNCSERSISYLLEVAENYKSKKTVLCVE